MSRVISHLQEETDTLTPMHSFESVGSARLPTYAQFNNVVRKSLDIMSPESVFSPVTSPDELDLALPVDFSEGPVQPVLEEVRSGVYAPSVEDERLIDNLELLRSVNRISVDVALERNQSVFQINEVVSGTVTISDRSNRETYVNVVYIQLQGWIREYRFLSMVDLTPQTTSSVTLKPLEKRLFDFRFKIPEQKILINDQIPLHARMYPSWQSTDLDTFNLGVPIQYQVSCHVIGLDHTVINMGRRPSLEKCEYLILGEKSLPIQVNALYPPLEPFTELEYNQAVCAKLRSHLIWINKLNIEKWTENLVLEASSVNLKLFSAPKWVSIRHVSPLHPVPSQKLKIPIDIQEGKLYDRAKIDLVAVTVKSSGHIPIVLTHSMFYKQFSSSQTDYHNLVASPLKHFVSKINKIGHHFPHYDNPPVAGASDTASDLSGDQTPLSNLIVDKDLAQTIDTLINFKVTYTSLPLTKPKLTPTSNGIELESNIKFLHSKGKDIAVAGNRFCMDGFQLILDFQGCHSARLYYLSIELSHSSKYLVHLYVPVKIA